MLARRLQSFAPLVAPGAVSPPARSPRDIGHDDRSQHLIRSLHELRVGELVRSVLGNPDVMAASHIVPLPLL